MRLVRAWALAVVCSCRAHASQPPLPPEVQSLLAAGRDLVPLSDEDEAWASLELTRIAAQVRDAASHEGLSPSADAMNDTVFGALGYAREVEDTDLKYVFLASVLRGRRGTCVGLGTLYMAVGRMLNWPVQGVLRPGHFYVRVLENEGPRNVELLRKGERMPSGWYDTRFPVTGGTAPEYGRPLSLSEVIGVVEYNIGNERRRQGRLEDARRAYRRSTQHFPDFAEAHASLGAVLQLLGGLDEARDSYRAAQRAYPQLPGLDRNMDLLEHELSPDTSRRSP
jgi:regulator of sirC expression with transglutaminase-like and TPR domain